MNLSLTLQSAALGIFVFVTHPSHAIDRRVLLPNERIADIIRHKTVVDARDALRFTITATVRGRHGSDASNLSKFADSTSKPSTVSMDVIEALPAITPDTHILLSDGTSLRFGDSSNTLSTLLVSDTTTSTGRSGLTVLAVDPITREMQGVMEQKGSRSMKIRQGRDGGVVTATEAEEMAMPAWECGVGNDDTLFHRVLEEEEEDHHHDDHGHEHNHEHDQHDHHHHHHDEFDPTISAIENLSKSLRGTKINPLNKRRLQDSTVPYNYQVDLFIEIDNDFITNTGGGPRDAAGITTNAYNYVNALVTAANVIYESEIDTHLHVNTIKLSTLYDSTVSTSDALGIMRSNYGGSTWHTEGVDVQHAMLGKGLGGGIAYIGVLCNSGWGFGLTAGLSGNFVSLDQRVVWDLKSFMHEIGHNFASGHSHDTNYYSPVIDTCGSSCPTSPGSKWSTIMSYCQHCPGDYGNLMYSFGGIYDGSGPKSDIANWIDKPELVANYDSAHKSVVPRREAHKMYSHVSSRGSCVVPPVPPVPVKFAVYDSILKVPKCSTAAESCSSGTLLDGRGNIGPSEQGKSPNTLVSCIDGNSGTYHSDESIDVIKVSSMDGGLLTAGKTAEIEATVYVYNPSEDFADFYYSTNPSNPTWTLIGTANPSGNGLQSIKMRYTLPSGGLQAVRVVFRWHGNASTSNPFQCPSSGYDDIDDVVFTVSSNGDTPATPNPTFSPTKKPTNMPTPQPTPSPTNIPTSQKPTPNPTNNPTQKPTNKPTSNPTKIPTENPTKKPTLNPTNIPTEHPTKKPTSNPTNIPTQKPTSKPTPNPTIIPTQAPTRKPTIQSTIFPTKQPVTPAPSSKPTYTPTTKPTAQVKNVLINNTPKYSKYRVVQDYSYNVERDSVTGQTSQPRLTRANKKRFAPRVDSMSLLGSVIVQLIIAFKNDERRVSKFH
eukprot:CCRYP_003932-RD/>CCRYP_003932-RD protein AED:0.26 eAED:0.31 QI:423/0.87/0.88/1/0.5/0.33/9/0/936